MTLAEVIALINSDIVPNGNNEITANVLRPILIEMLQQPNDLIGDLGDLNTDSTDTLVDAINSINNALSDVEGFVVLSGQGDPNQQTFPALSIADLYSEIDGLGSPLALWIYDGTKFIRLSDKYLSYEIPQVLTPTEQLTARSNIGATDRRLEELASDLTEGERSGIRQKISAAGLEDVGNIIDDTQASGDTTYSSDLIDQKLNLKLDIDALNGLLENPTYDSDTHIFTMDVVGGGTFSIDFPIEALITNVDLDDDNNLVITFEDGSVTTVPLNTLLVGVVKSVNGKAPNSQGQVVINAEDIADLPDVSNLVPYTGATANVNLNGKNLTNSKIRSGVAPLSAIPASGLGGHHFEVGNNVSIGFGMLFGTLGNGQGYIQQGRTDGSENNYQLNLNPNGGIVRAGGDLVSASNITADGLISTANDGNSSEWHEAYLAIADKANTDGSNTTGGTWNIGELTNNEVGDYVSIPVLEPAVIGIPPTDALGSTIGVMLMIEGAPLAIAENIHPNWDGYIYRAGEPLTGYPDHAKTGNYLIESKHRFRQHKHDTLDDLAGGVGNVILSPYSAIEHQYFEVNVFETMNSLEIDIKSPEQDELTGHEIRRNFYGQRISVNVITNAPNITFTGVQGIVFPNGVKPGVFKYVWDGVWLFDGYAPNGF